MHITGSVLILCNCRLAAALVRVDLAKQQGVEDVRKLLAGEELPPDEDEDEAATADAKKDSKEETKADTKEATGNGKESAAEPEAEGKAEADADKEGAGES